jgi:hypothetical protein
MQKLYLILFTILLSSCATLVNKPETEVRIYTDVDSVKFCVNNDTTKWYDAPAIVSVMRSPDDLIITAKKDTILKKFIINSGLTSQFWLGNMFCGAPISYIIDFYSSRRFKYPQYITLNLNHLNNDAFNDFDTWSRPEKNLININLTFSAGNLLFINKGDRYEKIGRFFWINVRIRVLFQR